MSLVFCFSPGNVIFGSSAASTSIVKDVATGSPLEPAAVHVTSTSVYDSSASKQPTSDESLSHWRLQISTPKRIGKTFLRDYRYVLIL